MIISAASCWEMPLLPQRIKYSSFLLPVTQTKDLCFRSTGPQAVSCERVRACVCVWVWEREGGRESVWACASTCAPLEWSGQHWEILRVAVKTRWLYIYLGLFREQPLKGSTQCLLGNAVYFGPGVCWGLVGSERCPTMWRKKKKITFLCATFFSLSMNTIAHIIYSVNMFCFCYP